MSRVTKIAMMLFVGLLVMAVSTLHAADDTKMVEGTVVSAESGKLVVKDDKSQEHTYSVDSSVKVMVDGKMAALEDLKKNMSVNVALDGDKPLSVNASSPMKDNEPRRRETLLGWH